MALLTMRKEGETLRKDQKNLIFRSTPPFFILVFSPLFCTFHLPPN